MVNIKEISDREVEKLKKEGFKVEYLRFGFGKDGNSIVEYHRLRRGGESQIHATIYGPEGKRLSLEGDKDLFKLVE
jgi:hypothetical protein